MSEVLLVNPRKRRRRRKMSALQRKYFGGKRRRRSRASGGRKRRRRVAVVTVRANPRRRRRHASVHIRRRRRNPSVRGIGSGIGGLGRQILPTIKAGAIGAVGGLINDVAYGFVKGYLPAALQSGWGRTAAKAVLAVGAGFAGNLVLRGKGGELARGAATVVIHEALRDQLAAMLPGVPLGNLIDTTELGYSDAGAPLGLGSDSGMSEDMGAYLDQGAYLNDNLAG